LSFAYTKYSHSFFFPGGTGVWICNPGLCICKAYSLLV
jgi:hypothetical protein